MGDKQFYCSILNVVKAVLTFFFRKEAFKEAHKAEYINHGVSTKLGTVTKRN